MQAKSKVPNTFCKNQTKIIEVVFSRYTAKITYKQRSTTKNRKKVLTWTGINVERTRARHQRRRQRPTTSIAVISLGFAIAAVAKRRAKPEA